jgi:radical SAM superfamily enzyme YgiQ (UPF0313 family)
MKVKSVLLIRSSHHDDNGRVVKSFSLIDRILNTNFAELGLPLIAACTPADIRVEMIDDCLQKTPETTGAEVVGISAMMIHFSRAIDLARQFRQLGKIVVMGGFLPTLHPELVQDAVDSLCIGEGESIWPRMLADIENNCLQKSYTSGVDHPLVNIPVPRYDLIRRNRLTLYPVQASRGCIHQCSYCSVICFYRNSFRTRPVEDVIRDIRAHRSKLMYFVDDNLMDAVPYAKELFRKMAGLKVYWGLQTSPSIAGDPEMLELAYKAGCRTVAIGFETISQSNLSAVSKNWAKTENYKQAVRTIQDAGIAVHALVMFGFPDDTKGVFDATVDFLLVAGVAGVDFFILTPYPATPLGKKYLQENLISDTNLNHYREPYVVFHHPHLTAVEIQRGFWHALKKFYSWKNTFKRMIYSNIPNKPYAFYSNMYYWRKIKSGIVPTHNQRGNYKINF